MRPAIGLVLLGLFLVPELSAQGSGGRQYYGGWTKHSTRPYYYRHYYYKATPSATEYSHHYGIYYPSHGHKTYMYNPHKKTYWGYWDGNNYSLLPADKQKETLDEIAESDFPKPGKAPKIPGAEDDAVMEAPPNDFPK